MIRLRRSTVLADAHASRAIARVGSVTSTSEAINKLNKYVADASPRHDLSTESWRAVWAGRFGSVDAQANHGGISTLLGDIDACAPGYAGGCDGTASKVIDGLNVALGLPGDNGWVSLPQLLVWLERSPINADDSPAEHAPPPPPADPGIVSDADRADATRTDAQIEAAASALPAAMRSSFTTAATQARTDAIAKIARLGGGGPVGGMMMVASTKSPTLPTTPAAPPPSSWKTPVLGLGLGAIASGALYFAGVSIAVSAAPLAAAALYVATR